MCKIKSNFIFLKGCKKAKVLPNFIYINSKAKSRSGSSAIQKARRFWLIAELKHHYAKLSVFESKAYALHQSLTSKLSFCEMELLLIKIHNDSCSFLRNNIPKKRQKLHNLKCTRNKKSHIKNEVEFIPNFLINKSTIPLTPDEEQLLNKGLNFALLDQKFPKKEIIVDTETALRFTDKEKSNEIRSSIKKCLLQSPNNKNPTKLHDTIASLNEKDLFVMKSDKGNSVVIVNRSDYDEAMKTLIDDGPYKEVENPHNKWKKSITGTVNRFIELFPPFWKRKMIASYTKIPCIYGLPKVHKPGNKYRPIVSNINAPNYNLSKWLCEKFSTLKQFDRFSVKNSIILSEKLKNVVLNPEEILVSFDISSYFTSVPVNEALSSLQLWLDKQNIDHMENDALF